MAKKKSETKTTGYEKVVWTREQFLRAWIKAAGVSTPLKGDPKAAYDLFISSMASCLRLDTDYELHPDDHNRLMKRCVSVTYHLNKAGYQAPFYPRKPKTVKKQASWAELGDSLVLKKLRILPTPDELPKTAKTAPMKP